MNILHITDSLPPETVGGAGRIALEIALHQSAMGHQVTILTTSDHPGERRTNDIRIITLPKIGTRWSYYTSVFSRRREKKICEEIRRLQPSIVHVHAIAHQMGFRWIRDVKRIGIRVLATCHDATCVRYGKVTGNERLPWISECFRYRWRWNPLRTFLSRRAMNQCDHIMVVSHALCSYLKHSGILAPRTIHNGIDLDVWKPTLTRQAARRKLNLPEDCFLFLIAGRMGVDKGSTIAVAALPKNSALIVAGDRISDEFAPIADRMHIFPNQRAEQMRDLYTACNAVLVPSRYLDPFPTVCLEAMAMERPVMATSWGGAKESVADGITGWILDPMNEQMWREKMQWCVKNEAELSVIGVAARKRMAEHFGLPTMLQKLDAIYRL